MDLAPKVGKRPKTGGRKKGQPNLLTGSAKENIAAVFTRLGSTAAMARWAKRHPTEFYKLYGRLIPTDLNVSGILGTYEAQPIPTEQRHSDALAGSNGSAANGHSTRSG